MYGLIICTYIATVRAVCRERSDLELRGEDVVKIELGLNSPSGAGGGISLKVELRAQHIPLWGSGQLVCKILP